MINVAIVGAGRIGTIRSDVIKKSLISRLVAVNDIDYFKPLMTAGIADSLEAIILRKDIDAVVVATPTKYHAEIAIAALQAGKHVLCEKPLGLDSIEVASIMSARKPNCTLHAGFNYRCLAHVRKAEEIIRKGQLGKLHFMRCRFGHGGRPDYEKEWCTQKDMAGGGALIEQGIHILDLVRHLFGEPKRIFAQTTRCFHNFSDTEDNAFCLLDTTNGMTQIHISWTQWKSIFELEIFGSDGYLRLNGRDGHYGPQTLVFGQRQKDHSRPTETEFRFADSPTSWELDWIQFENEIKGYTFPNDGRNGLKAQQLVQAAYDSAESNQWVSV